jgi:hypothetical protein
VIHTYRDLDALRSRFAGSVPAYCIGILFVLLLASDAASGTPFTWFNAVLVAMCVAMLFTACVSYRYDRNPRCGEIRLSDDGTCELETKRRVIRLHVNEIRSVKYRRNSEDTGESHTIHYQGGKIRVAERMTGFPDFLSRLKTLNPAVDLTSFPAGAWPDLGALATEKPGPVSRFIRSVVFPLLVIALLVYLAKP